MEFFIVSNSFAAPFVSDQSTGYVNGETAEAALKRFTAEYRHPAGLYAAAAFVSADAYHKRATPLARWLCNHELAKVEATRGKGAWVYYGFAPGDFKIDGKRIKVENPKGGQVVTSERGEGR